MKQIVAATFVIIEFIVAPSAHPALLYDPVQPLSTKNIEVTDP